MIQQFENVACTQCGCVCDDLRISVENGRVVEAERACGLAEPGSDLDRRGIYLPPAGLHWSLRGVPEQVENDATEEVYWELEKFLVLGLKANPNEGGPERLGHPLAAPPTRAALK